MRISFHGAAGGVTGSCHLLETGSVRVLVDCGLFQGSREMREENIHEFGFDPASVDFLLLTHAHLDHCGRIPLLVKRGFRGKVVCTSATRELAELVLMDTARLQEEDSERAKRHQGKGNRYKHLPEEPLYDSLDVEEALKRFTVEAPYDQPIQLADGVRATFQDAGHILGSASILLECSDRRVVFSGDLGSPHHPIVRDPKPCPAADFVIIETTYGGRTHRGVMETAAEFFQVVSDTVDGGGNVIVPAFALERAQEVIYGIREGLEHKRLPAGLRVFLDSPMATNATEVFRKHTECFDQHALNVLKERDPFMFPGLTFTRDRLESKAINDVRRGAVILAGSGMCTGGRVMHHLEQLLPRPECAVVFVGYAANGTPARSLIDGAKTLKLFGQDVPVRAKIHTINGFSGHGDSATLLKWHLSSGPNALTFLVHGEPKSSLAFQEELSKKGLKTRIPELHQSFEI
jgi:metallo-beta-lactamase family protein